jgi:hypothetical protein
MCHSVHEFMQQDLGRLEGPPFGAEVAMVQAIAHFRIDVGVNLFSAEQDSGAMVQVRVLRTDVALSAGFAAMEGEIFGLAVSL